MINCDAPPYVIKDINVIISGLIPEAFPTMPYAKPIPMYPNTVGSVSLAALETVNSLFTQHFPHSLIIVEREDRIS
jgi:hypothetical protein